MSPIICYMQTQRYTRVWHIRVIADRAWTIACRNSVSEHKSGSGSVAGPFSPIASTPELRCPATFTTTLPADKCIFRVHKTEVVLFSPVTSTPALWVKITSSTSACGTCLFRLFILWLNSVVCHILPRFHGAVMNLLKDIQASVMCS